MNLVKFFKLNTSDEKLNRVQDNLVRTLNPLYSVPLLNGILLQNVNLVIGTNIINHKLGRDLVGWYLTRKPASADIYDDQNNNTNSSQTLLLVSDTIITVDVYVF